MPERAIDLDAIAATVGDSDDVTIRRSGADLIFDICREENRDLESRFASFYERHARKGRPIERLDSIA